MKRNEKAWPCSSWRKGRDAILFRLLMWCFINSGIAWEFDASHHAVVVLFGLGAILVLPLARMPVLKLYWQRATSVLSSRVCCLVHLGPHLYSKRQLRKNHNFGTATGVEIMRLQKRWSCEVVGRDQFSQGDPGLCWGRSGLNWLLTWHFMATGTFVKFDASHHAVVLLLGLGAILVLPLARMPLLMLYWQRATSVLPSCVCYLVHLGPYLYSKSSCIRITAVGQPPASRVVKLQSCR